MRWKILLSLSILLYLLNGASSSFTNSDGVLQPMAVPHAPPQLVQTGAHSYSFNLAGGDGDGDGDGDASGDITSGVDIPDGEKCIKEAVGMASGDIQASQITVSSAWSEETDTSNDGQIDERNGDCARLNGDCVGWIAENSDAYQWIEIHFDSPIFIAAIATQGRENADQWVEEYTLYVSDDGKNFRPYVEIDEVAEAVLESDNDDDDSDEASLIARLADTAISAHVFNGNDDRNTVVTNILETPERASYIRIKPKSWNGRIAMRLEIYECTTDPCDYGIEGGCDPKTTCIWEDLTDWKAECTACPAGYSGTGESGCVDINECEVSNGGCHYLSECTNTEGGHTCGACPVGWEADEDGDCVDTNECATSNGGCDALTECINREGSFECSNCPLGYTGNGAAGCVDENECEINNGGCDELTTCTNTEGGWHCGNCPSGYSGTGQNGCVDIDECEHGNGLCDILVTCTNTPGSRMCGPCPDGYEGSGEATCINPNGEDFDLEDDDDGVDPGVLMNAVATFAADATAKQLTETMEERIERIKQASQDKFRMAKLENLEDKIREMTWTAQINQARHDHAAENALKAYDATVKEVGEMAATEVAAQGVYDAEKIIHNDGKDVTSSASGLEQHVKVDESTHTDLNGNVFENNIHVDLVPSDQLELKPVAEESVQDMEKAGLEWIKAHHNTDAGTQTAIYENSRQEHETENARYYVNGQHVHTDNNANKDIYPDQ